MGICMERLAMVIVTYKRRELLERLFASILKLTEAPWRIVVVDNENSERTSGVVKQFEQECTELWGTTEPDEEGGTARVVYFPQAENIGGSGGFSRGVGKAYALGASWFWVMDDDVKALWRHPGTALRCRRRPLLLAVPLQYRSCYLQPLLSFRLEAGRGVQGVQCALLRGRLLQPRGREEDRPARRALLHLPR